MLTANQREAWLVRVDTGPDLSDVVPAEAQKYADNWRFQRYHWVRDYLEGSRAAFDKRMLAEVGEPGPSGMGLRVRAGFVQNASPYTLEELQKATFAEAVELVDKWRSAGREFGGPSMEGVAAVFGQLVASDPLGCSRQASVLKGRVSLYVRTFIDRVAMAVRDGKEVDIVALLGLCKWVVEQDVGGGVVVDSDGGLVDRGWQWTRDTICRLVENVCDAESDGRRRYLVADMESALLDLLGKLIESPSQSYVLSNGDEDPRLMDYVTYAINSPRGMAMGAVMKCARWIADQKKEGEDNNAVIPGGFEAMPMIRDLLERQLAAGNSSFEAWAIVGMNFGFLYWVDPGWLAKHISSFFALESVMTDPEHAYGWAAWNAFLVCVRPHVEFLNLLRRQFEFAVGQTALLAPKEGEREQPFHKLAEHFIFLYAQGKLGLKDEGGLLERFLSGSLPATRSYAIDFAGRIAFENEELPPEVIERLKALWDWYWPKVGSKDSRKDVGASSFAMWFASGKFDPAWSMGELEKSVALVGVPQLDGPVVEQLAKVAATDITKAMELVEQLERADAKGDDWHVSGWVDDFKKILAMALKEVGRAKEIAEGVIDRLGRRGFIEFGELLG